jgi:hypothetical protein
MSDRPYSAMSTGSPRVIGGPRTIPCESYEQAKCLAEHLNDAHERVAVAMRREEFLKRNGVEANS